MPRQAGVGVVCVLSALLWLATLAQAAGAANCPLGVCLSPSPSASGSTQPPPSAAAVGQKRGFSDDGLANPDFSRSTFLGWEADTGAQLHRVALSWQSYEDTPGRYNSGYLAARDRDYNDDLARGIRQVIVLIGTPYWALTPQGKGSTSPEGVWRCDNGDDPCNAPPNVRDPAVRDAWKRWVTTVVSRYPKAAGVEIWNEPNLRWNWFQPQDPNLYGLLLQAAGQAAHAANPSMPVVSGSVSTYLGTSGPDKTNYQEFLRTVYRVAGASSFDAIGWHAYACNWQTSYHATAERHLGVLRGLKAEFGDSATPLWLTETGATTGPPDPATCSTNFSADEQRVAIADVLDWAVRAEGPSKDLPVVLIHSLFDSKGQPPVGSNGGFGLLSWRRDPVSGDVRVGVRAAYGAVRCRFHDSC